MCRELADRANRNMMQFGAATAAILGIGAALVGLLATADAIVINAADSNGEPPNEIRLFVMYLVVGIFAISLVSALLTVFAYTIRGRAENRAAKHLNTLILLEPKSFLPNSEDLRP